MTKRIIFSLCLGILAFVLSFAVLCPNIEAEYQKPQGKELFFVAPSACTAVSGGNIGKNGQVTVNSDKGCLVDCAVTNADVNGLRLELSEAVSTYTKIDFVYGNGQTAALSLYKGEKIAYAKAAAGTVRFYFKQDCHIKKISFYDESPSLATKRIEIKPIRYIVVAAITVITVVLAFFIDKKFCLCSKTLNKIKVRKKRILQFSIGVLISTTLAVLLEVFFRAVFGPDSVGQNFNLASFFTFEAIIMCVFVFAFERKTVGKKPERTVAFIILLMGALVIFTEPFSHNSSDEDSHYYFAVQNSFYDEAYLSQSDYNVKNTINFSINDSHALKPSLEKVKYMNAGDTYVTYATKVYSSLPHKAAGLLIAVARLFGASFWEKFLIGQFGILTVYAATVYFAIRKLKSGKMIASIIALFPTNLILASNYSYDPWVTGFTMLGISYYVSELEQPEKKISVLETLIMCGALFLAAMPKQVYLILMLLPFFMFKKWSEKKEKRRYYFILIAFFALMFVLFVLRSASSIGGGGDSRGGNVDPGGQIGFILKNPFSYAKILICFLKDYLSPINANKYITFFSYLGDGGSAAIFIVMLLWCVFTDKNQYNRFKNKNIVRLVVLAAAFALVCLIATALYVSFNPVASETINGCNPRYLIPIIVPVALTVANPGFSIIKNNTRYNFTVLAIVCTVVLYKILSVVSWPML